MNVNVNSQWFQLFAFSINYTAICVLWTLTSVQSNPCINTLWTVYDLLTPVFGSFNSASSTACLTMDRLDIYRVIAGITENRKPCYYERWDRQRYGGNFIVLQSVYFSLLYWSCSNSYCLDWENRCNSDINCGDWSDERDCGPHHTIPASTATTTRILNSCPGLFRL